MKNWNIAVLLPWQGVFDESHLILQTRTNKIPNLFVIWDLLFGISVNAPGAILI
jgi:hypothetical protein